MGENDTLYGSLDKEVKSNGEDSSKLEEEKRKLWMNFEKRQAFDRNNYNVSTTMAYYYYKYFITDVLPILIKDCMNNSNSVLNNKDIKQKTFDYEIQVSKNSEHIEQFMKYFNEFCISFGNYIVYKEFINYLNAFCLRNGIDITNEYRNSQVYNLGNVTLGDILNAYYGELQRFEYTDELIKSIQEEENTNVNGEKVIKTIKTR